MVLVLVFEGEREIKRKGVCGKRGFLLLGRRDSEGNRGRERDRVEIRG